jgi:hypothetical protein
MRLSAGGRVNGIADDDAERAVGDEIEAVVDGLLVVFGEIDAAGLDPDEAAARPDEVGEFGAHAVGDGFNGRWCCDATLSELAVSSGSLPRVAPLFRTRGERGGGLRAWPSFERGRL